ncbi:MAG: ATP-binding protein [Chloroflexi bacterium]|nr:ATP-binding protein [Chloroflexota bacterium]
MVTFSVFKVRALFRRYFRISKVKLGLPNAQVLKWGQNFLPKLADVGYEMLETLVRTLFPLTPGSPSESLFETRLPNLFNQRRDYCRSHNQPFTIDLAYLRQLTWGGNDYVEQAIKNRLDMINNMGLFSAGSSNDQNLSISELYENACLGQPMVFDMRDLSSNLQNALVRSVNQTLESLCNTETLSGAGRYPFVFYEEAHFYISEAAIVNIITRGRHIGLGSVFVTNTPQKLPDTVFRQLDNLFLLSLTHKDDIRNVSKNSFTDEATIESFATRMPEHHALIMGNVTDRYPLVVKVEPLPENVPTTGRTKSTWDRFESPQNVEEDIPF